MKESRNSNKKSIHSAVKLPQLLSLYKDSDFSTKQKARFIYYLIWVAIIGTCFLVASTIYVQIGSIEYDKIFYPIIISEILLILFFGFCQYLVIRGKYILASYLFISMSMLCVWYIMWTDTGNIIARFDTVVIILALITLIPLIINKHKLAIFIYVIVNTIILIIYAHYSKSLLGLPRAAVFDYIVDTSVAMLFIGIVAYYLHDIFKQTLGRAEQDLNNRIEAEENLKKSELRHTGLFENAQIGIYQTTPDGDILQANPAMLELQGLKSIDEVKNKNFEEVDVFVNKNRNEFVEKIERDGYVKDFESTWVKRNGEFIIVRENARAVRNEKGETLYYEGFIVNITKRKLAEKALKESELRYTELFNNAQIGIFQTAPGGEIIKANPALVEMLGYESVKELVGRNLLKDNFFVNKDRSDFEGLMQKQSYVRGFESEWRKKNGEIITIKENSRTVKDDKGNRLFLEGFIENITERKKIEKALKEKEEKYRSLMENMNDIVMLVDNNDKVLYVNKRFSEKLGYSESEIIGKIGYEILIDPKDQETIINANKDRTQNLGGQYEATFIAKNGTKFDFLVSGAPVKDADGNIIGSIGNMIDITERKIGQEKLKKSQQLFQTLAQSSPVGIFRTKADGYTTYVNPKWMEISGLSFDEALGDGWLKAVHPDDKKILQLNWELHSLKSKESRAEYRFIKEGGTIVWVLGHAVPEIIDNKIQGYIGTLTDITERKIAEKKMQESEEKYRTIIEAFPDVIMISDFERNILYANDALEKLTGIKPEDYTNKNRKARIYPDDLHLVQAPMQELLNGDKKHTKVIEHRFIDSWGNLKWFAGTMSKMTYNNKPVIQTITRDITEKKQIEKELEKHREHLEVLVKERTEELAATNEELTSTNEELHSQREELQVTLRNLQNAQKQLIQSEKMASLGVLASGVAHEINNPLNFIRGGAFGLEDYIQENLESHKESLRIFINSINEGVDRAATIVTSLNHYSYRDESRITECNIHDIIDNCLNILRNQLRDTINIEKNYTLKNYLLKCNEGKMHQAILNIITNAVQAIDGKGEIKITTRTKNKQLQIEISDSGCGISTENLSKIFDPFFTTKEPGKGTGLGLSITYNIIEEHNGKVEVNSELYKGTTVIITLPVITN